VLAQAGHMDGYPRRGFATGLNGLHGGRVGDHSARCTTVQPKAAMLVYRPAAWSGAQITTGRSAEPGPARHRGRRRLDYAAVHGQAASRAAD
jgi:hypothetical protein